MLSSSFPTFRAKGALDGKPLSIRKSLVTLL